MLRKVKAVDEEVFDAGCGGEDDNDKSATTACVVEAAASRAGDDNDIPASSFLLSFRSVGLLYTCVLSLLVLFVSMRASSCFSALLASCSSSLSLPAVLALVPPPVLL